jgi:radical SAM protein with 4Fe4S-binding SPASM domain
MLTIYVKPTNYCNIGCDHCYLPLDTRADKLKMSEGKLDEVAHFAKDLMVREGHTKLNVIWHGGEPMVLSPEYFERAGEIFESVLGADAFRESIQTSLIPYTEAWAPLVLSRFNGVIGSSVDFSLRTVKGDAEGYLDLWLSKVNRARASGITIIPGMVPTKLELGKGKNIIQWMVDNSFYEFNVDRYSAVGSTNSFERPNNAQHARFLIELFDECMDRLGKGLNAPKINVVSSGIAGVLFGEPGDRWGTSCQRDFVVIEPDGSTNTCPDRARHEQPFSNTREGADAFGGSKKRIEWIVVADITHKKSHCMTCDYRSWCKSGCPVTPNGPSEGEKECSGYKSYLLHIENFCTIEENRQLCVDYLNIE